MKRKERMILEALKDKYNKTLENIFIIGFILICLLFLLVPTYILWEMMDYIISAEKALEITFMMLLGIGAVAGIGAILGIKLLEARIK